MLYEVITDNDFLSQYVGNKDELLAYLDGIDVAAACAASGIDQRNNFV